MTTISFQTPDGRSSNQRPSHGLALLLTATLAGLSAFHARAAEPLQTASLTVAYADLDLSQPADQKVLGARVDRAVRTVCRTVSGNQPDPLCLTVAERMAAPQMRQAIKRAQGRGYATATN